MGPHKLYGMPDRRVRERGPIQLTPEFCRISCRSPLFAAGIMQTFGEKARRRSRQQLPTLTVIALLLVVCFVCSPSAPQAVVI